jgi:hypothetical protein
MEGHIQHPVQAVLNGPMRTRGLRKGAGFVNTLGADVIRPFNRNLAFDLTMTSLG